MIYNISSGGCGEERKVTVGGSQERQGEREETHREKK